MLIHNYVITLKWLPNAKCLFHPSIASFVNVKEQITGTFWTKQSTLQCKWTSTQRDVCCILRGRVDVPHTSDQVYSADNAIPFLPLERESGLKAARSGGVLISRWFLISPFQSALQAEINSHWLRHKSSSHNPQTITQHCFISEPPKPKLFCSSERGVDTQSDFPKMALLSACGLCSSVFLLKNNSILSVLHWVGIVKSATGAACSFSVFLSLMKWKGFHEPIIWVTSS